VRKGERSTRILEWSYSIGPPRRSWLWYLSVIVTGVGGADLLFLVAPDDSAWTLSMILCTCVVLAFSLVPSRDVVAQLDGDLLYLWDVKRKHLLVEQNLREFATWKVDTIPADRLNAVTRVLILRPRNARSATEIRLSGDDATDDRVLSRIARRVSAAPSIAPTLLERVDRRIQRLIGWR